MTNITSLLIYADDNRRISIDASTDSTNVKNGICLIVNLGITVQLPDLSMLTYLRELEICGDQDCTLNIRLSLIKSQMLKILRIENVTVMDDALSLPNSVRSCTLHNIRTESLTVADIIEALPRKLQSLIMWELYTKDNTLSRSIGRLKRLTSLTIADMDINRLPSTIGRLKRLTVLHINGTKIKRIPRAIGRLTALTNLTIIYNRVSKLPTILSTLTNLEYLDLRSNRLSDCLSADVFDSMPKLRTVCLDYNPKLRGTVSVSDDRIVTREKTKVRCLY